MSKKMSKTVKNGGFGMIFLLLPKAKISLFLVSVNTLFLQSCAVDWSVRPDQQTLQDSAKISFLQNQERYHSLKKANNWSENESSENEILVDFYERNGTFSHTARVRNFTKK